MVKSMTGFGRAELSNETYRMLVEMKAVNHRYLDMSIKLPKKFYLFESRVRNLIKEYAGRGKVDVFVSYEDYSGEQLTLQYNQRLAQEYMAYFRQMSQEFQIENDIRVSHLAQLPEVFTREQAEEDEEQLWQLLEEALRQAGQDFAAQRSREGEQLKRDLLEKLSALETLVAFVEERSPQIVAEYRERLEARIRELLAGAAVDEARLLTEAAVFADKTCVDEETVRLRSHIAGMREALEAEGGEGVGRKLDFLAQEMNREANTILSKCSDQQAAAAAIQMKTEIEKIREQVQNIE